MNFSEIFEQLINGLQQTTFLEFIAVISGIVSVWFSRKENILVYPIGLINTTIFIYLSIKGQLFGEASVNLYYTVMSIYGWWLWSKKDEQQKVIVLIKHSTKKELMQQLALFFSFFIVIGFALTFLGKKFAPGVIPVADAFASATAYTAMWLMARKKVESWYWWIATNVTSIPLYFIKGYVFTSFQFLILLILAFAGLLSWRQKATYARS